MILTDGGNHHPAKTSDLTQCPAHQRCAPLFYFWLERGEINVQIISGFRSQYIWRTPDEWRPCLFSGAFWPAGHSKRPRGFTHFCMFPVVLNWFIWFLFVFSDFCRGFCSVWCLWCCALTLDVECCDQSCGFDPYGQCPMLMYGYKTAALIEENRFILNLFVLKF